ncbi:MAG: AbrB/MazE/SpoVT family DNA-binding domain-containing protein [Bryobacterales bacterium]|nr:AbrB/MazE/SpoVT family DNA-binding domain-containing protein [Bryobacterales bacterium]
MPNEIQVAKWGNSLAVRLPRMIAKEAGITEGDRMTLSLSSDGSIVMRPARRKYDLDELVSRITPRNRHSQADWGNPVGQEEW